LPFLPVAACLPRFDGVSRRRTYIGGSAFKSVAQRLFFKTSTPFFESDTSNFLSTNSNWKNSSDTRWTLKRDNSALEVEGEVA